VALFDDDVTLVPAPKRPRSRATIAGLWALAVALVALVAISFLPTAYVIQQPGPVYDTLGTAPDENGKEVPLITVSGAQTYPTKPALDLLTVQVRGNRERTPSWIELATAWFDPSMQVLPIDAVYPEGQSTNERDQESAAMMVDSQKEATAAALTHLGYDVKQHIEVYSLTKDSAAQGVLQKGDVIDTADGHKITTADQLRTVVNKSAGSPIELGIVRDGKASSVSVTPKKTTIDGQEVWLIGVTLTNDFDFPIQVTIQLNNVGGPSAGMMFALGIIDKLTPDQLNAGRHIAGTGTIDAEGDVGPIGGIRQKLWGAVDAGATYFLAPDTNCDEVVGHVPDGLRVFSVKTLDDSLKVLDAIRAGTSLDKLPTCTAK
jgi:Lon-like protease